MIPDEDEVRRIADELARFIIPEHIIQTEEPKLRRKPWYRALIAQEKQRNKGGDAIGRQCPSAKGRSDTDLP